MLCIAIAKKPPSLHRTKPECAWVMAPQASIKGVVRLSLSTFTSFASTFLFHFFFTSTLLLTVYTMRFTATLFSSLITISFVTGLQVVGPTTTLTLTNKFLAPDGVNRSASVVNGGVQGPLITGYPVIVHTRI
jgi:hypothetical protein